MGSVGFLNGLKLASGISGSNILPFPATSEPRIASPWAPPSHFASIVYEDIGLPAIASRDMAMMVPGVVKARALLHSVIATRPLRAYRDDAPLPVQPTWLYRTDTGIHPRTRTKLILDDLIFNEASLLRVTRGTDGQIVDAYHVAYDRWYVNDDAVIIVDDEAADAADVIWIPGPGPGFLVTGRELIQSALNTDRAWGQRVRNPFPAMVIQHTDDTQLEPEEAVAFVNAVAAARRNPDSAVMYLQPGLELVSHQAEETHLFEEGRNANRLDLANHLNVPAALLDGSPSEASLTYSNSEGRRNDFADLTVPYWAGPIEDAFSMDNVVPRGQYIRFDFTDYISSTTAPTGPTVED